MEDLEKLYKKLEKYNDFNVEEASEIFLDTVDKIVLKNNINSLNILFKYLDNDAPVYVMECLMAAISYYGPPYVKELLKNIYNIESKSDFWVKAFLYRILNTKEYLNELKKFIHLAPKESLLKLFNSIEQESPRHKKIIDELRQDLEKN